MTILVMVFLVYNAIVYFQGATINNHKLSETALKGEQLYQEYNCTACHQIYGLGGYLGPDLTNVISVKGKGEGYVKAFLNSGVKSMPKFNFSEEEKSALVAFLSAVDKTGFYPNYEAEKNTLGWIELKYKKNAE